MSCPSCGKESPEEFPFCPFCGTALDEASGAEREERKVVTSLFCDLVGFTARAERLDPEDVRVVLSRYHERVRAELERFGGTVEKFIGDAVMALFGAPVAREDDPERAVRAALAVREAIAEVNAEDVEIDLRVRVGITTGEALVRLGARPEEGEGMAAGDVVNTAARLQAAAPEDGILVDEPTYRATSRAIEVHDCDRGRSEGQGRPGASVRGCRRGRASASTPDRSVARRWSAGNASSTPSSMRSSVPVPSGNRSSSPSSGFPGSASRGSCTSCSDASRRIRS